MSDDLDSDPEAPAGGANPFSPTGAGGAASSNEGRLMQVLEMMAGVTRDQQTAAAARAASKEPIRAKDIAKVVKGPEPFTPTTRDAELAQWGNWSWELEQWLACIDEGRVLLQTSRNFAAE